MKHILEKKVYYADTDAYGVVWHGSYLRWMEAGRIEYCEMLGYNLLDLQSKDIVLPVVNINVRYKSSAKINDEVLIETTLEKENLASITFRQIVKSKLTGKTFVDALVDVVAVSNAGKLYRKFPLDLTLTKSDNNDEIEKKDKICV